MQEPLANNHFFIVKQYKIKDNISRSVIPNPQVVFLLTNTKFTRIEKNNDVEVQIKTALISFLNSFLHMSVIISTISSKADMQLMTAVNAGSQLPYPIGKGEKYEQFV